MSVYIRNARFKINVTLDLRHLIFNFIKNLIKLSQMNMFYWFKFPVIIYTENPIEMKISAYWFKCSFVSYYLHGNSIEKAC